MESRNFIFTSACWGSRHVVSQFLLEGFSLLQVTNYSNSIASYQINLIRLSDNVSLNPSPNCTKQRNLAVQQQHHGDLLASYAIFSTKQL